MRMSRLFVPVVMLALAFGCSMEAPPDGRGGAEHAGREARMKAHTVAETATVTGTQSATASGTGTHAGTVTITNTASNVTSATDYYTVTGTVTGTVKVTAYYLSWPGTSTNTTTQTRTTTVAGPVQSATVFTKTVTATVTNSRNGTETKTATAAATGFVTFTGTTTVTVTNTVTSTVGQRQGSGTRMVTATGTAVQTGTAAWTWHAISTLTQTTVLTNTAVVITTGTAVQTVTLTTTATDTQTGGSCLQLWRDTTCGQWCSGETQPDRGVCQVYLDCYRDHGCGPSTCGGPDDVCGVNTIRPASGVAPKLIADQVYQCMGCPGTVPVTSCAGLPDTTPCSDGNPCTVQDRCLAGACVLTSPVSCAASDQCHDAGTCNPATGLCSNPSKPDGTTCDDGSACTSGDACSAGTCGGTPYVCDDGLDCTADLCNGDGTCTFSAQPGTCAIDGACHEAGAANPENACQACDPAQPSTWSNVTDETPCDDGIACTYADACRGGVCGGILFACSDDLPCTTDSCNGDGTCTFSRIAGACVIDSACYGAGAPNPANLCQVCDPSNPSAWSPKTVQCSGSDACHGPGLCNPATGECSPPVPLDGMPCTTGNPCITGESCKQGVCGSGTPRDCGTVCDDGAECDDVGQCISLAAPTVCQAGSSPKPNEVIVWEQAGFGGTCRTLVKGSYPNGSSFPPVHNDSIRSLKVGCDVRALLYQNAASPNYGGFVATYEAGSRHDLGASSNMFQLGPGVGGLPPLFSPQTSAIRVDPRNGQRVAYAFMGDYPHDTATPAFSHQIQGLCHSDSHWYFTNKTSLFKIALTENLDAPAVIKQVSLPYSPSGIIATDGGMRDAHTLYCSEQQYLQDPPSQPLLAGCNHMGDPDYSRAHDLILLPLEGCCIGTKTGPKIAAYDPSDLSLVGVTELAEGQANAGWVAVDPREGETHLWASNSEIQGSGVFIYTVDWNKLAPPRGAEPVTGFLPQAIDLQPPTIQDINGSPLHLNYMQGGVFTPDGSILYLANSETGTHGIEAFDPNTGKVIAPSGDNYGPFNFQRDGVGQEEEGIDYLDPLEYYRTYGQVLPGAGELHAILSFTACAVIEVCDDTISIKHYTAWPERYCKEQPGDDEVTIWSNGYFKNTCRTLQVGNYPSYRWFYPLMTDWPSSIRVGKNVYARLWDDDGFHGGTRVVRGDVVGGGRPFGNTIIDICDPADDSQSLGQISDFGKCGWNERVSAIEVAKLPVH